MHIGESKHVYENTGMGIDMYLGDEPQRAYQKVRLVHNLGINACMSESMVNQSRMIIKASDQSINHKVTHVESPPKPIYLA